MSDVKLVAILLILFIHLSIIDIIVLICKNEYMVNVLYVNVVESLIYLSVRTKSNLKQLFWWVGIWKIQNMSIDWWRSGGEAHTRIPQGYSVAA